MTDRRGRVCTLESLMLACSRMQPGDGESRWPIVAIDRTTDGTFFGISTSALYRSRDAGRSWERIGEDPYLYLYEVLASADGSHAFVKDSQRLLTWREGQGLTPLPPETAPSLGFTVQARRARLWIATGFEAAKDEWTQTMLRSSDTVLVGPGFRALVLASVDEGSSWRRIDEYEGAIATAAWLGDDDILRLCMSDGTIHEGKIDAKDGAIAGSELALVPADGRRFGGEWATWIVFPDTQNGWVGGNSFFRGASLLRTFDGGRSWSAEPATREVTRAFRLGSGACVRVVGFWGSGSRVELWRAGEFAEIRRFEECVNDARVDAGGCLLVRMADGVVWSLAEDCRAWSRLGTIPVPPR